MKLGTHISPDDFIEIQRRVNQKFIVSRKHPILPLTIYNYTSKTQNERVWDVYTRHCRGLIIDDQNKIIARPFPKIFNFGEPDEFGKDIEKITKGPNRSKIVEKLKSLGFKFITVDLQGFRSGSLNEVLTETQKQKNR